MKDETIVRPNSATDFLTATRGGYAAAHTNDTRSFHGIHTADYHHISAVLIPELLDHFI